MNIMNCSDVDVSVLCELVIERERKNCRKNNYKNVSFSACSLGGNIDDYSQVRLTPNIKEFLRAKKSESQCDCIVSHKYFRVRHL